MENHIQQLIQQVRNSIPFGWILLALFSVEIISFAGYEIPTINIIAFTFLVCFTLIASVRSLRYGIFILLAELCIGSKGYLFSFGPISIRLALFLAVFAAFVYWAIRERRIAFFTWPLWKPTAVCVAVIALASVSGALRGNELTAVFLDANGYLYLGIILPLTQAIRTKRDWHQLFGVLCAAVIMLAAKTVIILFLFSQSALLPYTIPGIYRWVRDTGIGEITRMGNGFSRIFFQSHVYLVITFFLVAPLLAFQKRWRPFTRSKELQAAYFLFSISMLVIFLSYSRSFWVGNVGTLGLLFLWLLFREKIGLAQTVRFGFLCIVTFLFSYVFAFLLVNIPLPGNAGVSVGSLLAERTTGTSSEPAAVTRLQLLKPLAQATLRHPIIGSGMGTTVTYKSKDQRNLDNNVDGLYTTYAFEWGYLDMLLEFGLIGAAIFAYLIARIFRLGLARMQQQPHERLFTLGMLSSMTAMLVIHVFTPYLNHPLGIGWVLIVAAYMTTQIRTNENE